MCELLDEYTLEERIERLTEERNRWESAIHDCEPNNHDEREGYERALAAVSAEISLLEEELEKQKRLIAGFVV